MSYRVALICEDHTLDQYILRPVAEALLREIGKPRAIVRPVTDPRLKGLGDLRKELPNLIKRYGPISDLVIVAIDADCEDGQEGRVSRAASFASLLQHAENAVLVVAIQELEVWAMWGARGRLDVPWSTVRAECHPKEVYFERLLTNADARQPGRGRTRLIAESLASGWASLATGCPELAELAMQVRAALSA